MITSIEKNEDRARAMKLLKELKRIEKKRKFEKVVLNDRTTVYVSSPGRREQYEQYGKG